MSDQEMEVPGIETPEIIRDFDPSLPPASDILDIIDRSVGTLIAKASFYGTFLGLSKIIVVHTLKPITWAGIAWAGDHLILFINSITFGQYPIKKRRGIIKHEMAHYYLKHLCGTRHNRMFSLATMYYPEADYRGLLDIINVAQDLEINGAIVPIDELPDNIQTPEKYKFEEGLLAEEYLHLLRNRVKFVPQIGFVLSNGDGEMDPDQDVNYEKLMDDVREKMLEEQLKDARQRGSEPSGLDRILGKLRPPKLDWKVKFSSSVISFVKSRSILPTYSRLNRRIKGLPGVKYKTKPDLYVMQDTSGSMSEENLAHTSSEIYGMRGHFRKIIVIVIDADVHAVYVFKNKIESIKGGGGSSFVPGFDYVEKNHTGSRPPLVVLLTDGDITVPDNPKVAHIWWVLCDGDRNIPEGHTKILLPKD